MSAEPLSREERDEILRLDGYARTHPTRYEEWQRWEATVRAEAHRAGVAEGRAGLLRLCITHYLAWARSDHPMAQMFREALANDDQLLALAQVPAPPTLDAPSERTDP